MNRYPLWKNLLIAIVLLVGTLYFLPNLFGEDPALQISSTRGSTVDLTTQSQVERALAQANIQPKGVTLGNGQLLVRFSDPDTQLSAQDQVKQVLGNDYVVALNLAPTTPAWLQALDAKPMYLGLDLRGGVHFLMEVDMPAAVQQAEERYVSDIRSLLRDNKVRYISITRDPGGVQVKFRDSADREAARTQIAREFPGLTLSDEGEGGDIGLRGVVSETKRKEIQDFALQQNITTLRNRVNELGVAEPVIQQQGSSRIVVQLPGVQDTARAKEILGATATLEYRMVDTAHDVQKALAGQVPPGSRLYRERNGTPILLDRRVIVTGDQIIDAASGFDQQSGSPAVFVTLDGAGAKKMSQVTRESIGKPMAVVYIENKSETRLVDGKPVNSVRRIEEVINVATIRDHFSKRFQTTGLSSTEEARDLALLLRAGALAAPMRIIEERTVGPSLGQENIDQGFESVLVGFVVVLIFMIVYYRLFGMVANVALFANVILIVAVLSLLQATLTLPGIAGIVLTVGMAVDANVLIFERIREELRLGNSPQAAIYSGYEKAFSTIADANITTLIAAVVLFSFGTGPIKGFAVTLSIGIVTSMFTAIMGTRALINLMYGRKRAPKLSI